MGRKVRARVREGKLELLEPIDLPEGRELTLTIDDVSDRVAAEEALARAWGGWCGLVDADALIRDLYEARLRPGRAPLGLMAGWLGGGHEMDL